MALPMMTATQVAKSIAENTGISTTDVRHVLDDYRDLILSELEACNRVKILNVVQLEPKVKPARKARMGRNPATGEPVKIAAKPAEAVVRARVLSEGKSAVPTLSRLKSALAKSKPAPRKTTKAKKSTKKPVKARRR
jgi:nucleoid DNA-binding protein